VAPLPLHSQDARPPAAPPTGPDTKGSRYRAGCQHREGATDRTWWSDVRPSRRLRWS